MELLDKITIFEEETASALIGLNAGPLSWSNWNFQMLVFSGGRKTGEPRKQPLGAWREPTAKSTHISHRVGIEPGPHW